MAKVINLRTARKQRRRACERKAADENAARSGEPAPLIEMRREQKRITEKRLDGHRLDDDDDYDND